MIGLALSLGLETDGSSVFVPITPVEYSLLEFRWRRMHISMRRRLPEARKYASEWHRTCEAILVTPRL